MSGFVPYYYDVYTHKGHLLKTSQLDLDYHCTSLMFYMLHSFLILSIYLFHYRPLLLWLWPVFDTCVLCECHNRLHKDVALVSLSNILHQVHYSDEAAIVIHAAIDISRELAINYFTLGNIYAVIYEQEIFIALLCS